MKNYILIFSLIFLTSCQINTKIKDILANPAKFEGQEVVISGVVVASTNIPYLSKYYTLKDETGEIIVYLKKGKQNVPNEGAEFTAKGKVIQNVKVFGGQSIHIEESQ